MPDPARENLERLATVLEALGGRVEVAGGRLGPSAIRTFLAAGDRTLVATELAPVDVLQGHAHVPRFADLDRDAVDVDLGGVNVRVCSLDALRAMKQASNRPQDRDDLEALDVANS